MQVFSQHNIPFSRLITSAESLIMAKPKDQQAAIPTTQEASTSDEEEGRSDVASSPPSGQVVLVTDLATTYPGISIGEKVDQLIQQEKVVMINRSWCLFSIDAIDFLVQLGVHVQSLEVDHHPQ